MAERLPVPAPAAAEELRQWAETVSDLHYVGSIVVEKGDIFFPGEDVDEIRIVWQETTPDFRTIINSLSSTAAPPTQIVTPGARTDVKLGGPTGKAKRRWIDRLGDGARGLLGSLGFGPGSHEKQRMASEAAERHMNAGAVALNSLHAAASEVPGLGTALKIGEEALLGLGQRLGFCRSRGP